MGKHSRALKTSTRAGEVTVSTAPALQAGRPESEPQSPNRKAGMVARACNPMTIKGKDLLFKLAIVSP